VIEASEALAIADAYDLPRPARLEGPVARGQLGRVWRLRTPARDYAVKEWYAQPDLDDVGGDAAFVESARAAGVFTPKILRTAGGDVATLVDGSAVRVFEWVDLRSRTRLLDPAEVGWTVARLHIASHPSDQPVDNWFATGFGERSWRDLHARLVAEQAPFAGELGSIVDDLVEVESVIEPHERRIVCHRDLWADNVLATTDGRVCVIDFENLGPADPSMELAMVLFEFGVGDPARAHRIHAAYRDAGGPGRVTRRGHFSMVVAEQAHIGQLACARWVGASDPVERDRLAAWFREIPEDPVTLARIDRILAAVT
jgi:Ser/Thr protein kinase RdoA (MazF antagonist)